MTKYFLLITLLVWIICPPVNSQNINYVPDRIILNLTVNPHSEMAVTWRSINKAPNPEVQYCEVAPGPVKSKDAKTVKSEISFYTSDDKKSAYHYSAIMTGLKEKTKYAYRVGSDSGWSEWNHFYTADKDSGSFSFVYLGDPQNNIKSDISRVFREAFRKAPEADFWVFGGDLATDPTDVLWGELFYSAGFIFSMTPVIAASGNHDHTPVMINGNKERLKSVSPIWNAHFTLPENGLKGLEEISYHFDYQGTKFVVLETFDRLKEQSVWLDSLLSVNKCRWTVVIFHYPVYSTGKDRDNKKIREALMPVFDKYGVDLVLTGHDHNYARSHKIYEGKVNTDKGTVYLVSVSGPKAYQSGTNYDELMAKRGDNLQLYQVISVDKNRLMFKAYTADGALYDEFELAK